MKTAFAKHTITAAAVGLAFATAVPATAAAPMHVVQTEYSEFTPINTLGDTTAQHHRWKHKRKRGHYHQSGHYYGQRDYLYYDEPIYRDTRVWRGRDGHYYCRKENGTTGLLIGAGVGGLIGHEVAGSGDKTLGTLLGAVGGAVLGREIDRSNSSCR